MTTEAPDKATRLLITPLDVTAFLQRRLRDKGLRIVDVAHHLGLQRSGIFSQVFSGRARSSHSKHFQALCILLDITPEQQQAIANVERKDK